MTETLQYCRKNRWQVSKDISNLLSVKNIKEIRIIRKDDGIYVYSGNPENRYEKLCYAIKEQSREIRRAFNTDDATSCTVRTTTEIYDKIVDNTVI